MRPNESPRREPGASESLAGDSLSLHDISRGRRLTDSAWHAVAWAISLDDLKLSKHVGEDRIRRVLLVLALHVNQEFESAVGRELIAALTGLPTRVVSHALEALDGSGIVERIQKSRPIRRRLCVRQSLTEWPEPSVRQSRTDDSRELSGLSSGLSSGRALREGEGEDLDTDPFPSPVTQRARDHWGEWSNTPNPADAALAALAEAGLPAEHRTRLLEISASTSTSGVSTGFPAGRLSAPKHRVACIRLLRAELDALAPKCPRCGKSLDACQALDRKLAPEDRCDA